MQLQSSIMSVAEHPWCHWRGRALRHCPWVQPVAELYSPCRSTATFLTHSKQSLLANRYSRNYYSH